MIWASGASSIGQFWYEVLLMLQEHDARELRGFPFDFWVSLWLVGLGALELVFICDCKKNCIPPWPAWRRNEERWDRCRTWSPRYQLIGIVRNVVEICSQGDAWVQKVKAQFLANPTAMCTKLPVLTFFFAPQVLRQQDSTMRHQMREGSWGRKVNLGGWHYICWEI